MSSVAKACLRQLAHRRYSILNVIGSVESLCCSRYVVQNARSARTICTNLSCDIPCLSLNPWSTQLFTRQRPSKWEYNRSRDECIHVARSLLLQFIGYIPRLGTLHHKSLLGPVSYFIVCLRTCFYSFVICALDMLLIKATNLLTYSSLFSECVKISCTIPLRRRFIDMVFLAHIFHSYNSTLFLSLLRPYFSDFLH